MDFTLLPVGIGNELKIVLPHYPGSMDNPIDAAESFLRRLHQAVHLLLIASLRLHHQYLGSHFFQFF